MIPESRHPSLRWKRPRAGPGAPAGVWGSRERPREPGQPREDPGSRGGGHSRRDPGIPGPRPMRTPSGGRGLPRSARSRFSCSRFPKNPRIQPETRPRGSGSGPKSKLPEVFPVFALPSAPAIPAFPAPASQNAAPNPRSRPQIPISSGFPGGRSPPGPACCHSHSRFSCSFFPKIHPSIHGSSWNSPFPPQIPGSSPKSSFPRQIHGFGFPALLSPLPSSGHSCFSCSCFQKIPGSTSKSTFLSPNPDIHRFSWPFLLFPFPLPKNPPPSPRLHPKSRYPEVFPLGRALPFSPCCPGHSRCYSHSKIPSFPLMVGFKTSKKPGMEREIPISNSSHSSSIFFPNSQIPVGFSGPCRNSSVPDSHGNADAFPRYRDFLGSVGAAGMEPLEYFSLFSFFFFLIF